MARAAWVPVDGSTIARDVVELADVRIIGLVLQRDLDLVADQIGGGAAFAREIGAHAAARRSRSR